MFLDCQTTGGSPRSGQLLEIGYQGLLGDPKTSLVQQANGANLPKRITRLTGITLQDLESAKSKEVVYDELLATASAHQVCVIHCAQFELRFLTDLAEQCAGTPILPWQVICTLDIAKRLHPDFPSRSIRALAGRYGLHLDALKRASCHVEATRFIWSQIVPLLADRGIFTLPDLQTWLATHKPPKRKKMDFLISQAVRLAAPKAPGVYRFRDGNGRVLYVGKATSLHSRINSYFRGKKRRHPRLNEMLSQAHDVEYETFSNHLEAALIESDLIKDLDPPYNVALKAEGRRVFFANRAFDQCFQEPPSRFAPGPLARDELVTQLNALRLGLSDKSFLDDFFHEPAPAALVHKALCRLLNEFELDASQVTNRRLLFIGKRLKPRLDEEAGADFDKEMAEDLTEDVARNDQLESLADSNAGDEAKEEKEWTEDDVYAALARFLARSSEAIHRAKWLVRLSNCELSWKVSKRSAWQSLSLKGGRLQTTESRGGETKDAEATEGMDLKTFDRLRVLLSELKICVNRCYAVRLKCNDYGELDQEALARAIKNF